jgi:hypothetical protein
MVKLRHRSLFPAENLILATTIEAGLAEEYYREGKQGKRIPDVVLIEHFQSLAADRNGSIPSTAMLEEGWFHPMTYVNRFGSWDDALATVNLLTRDEDPFAYPYTEDAILSELQRLNEETGRSLTFVDINESRISKKGVFDYFDSLIEALRAGDIGPTKHQMKGADD